MKDIACCLGSCFRRSAVVLGQPATFDAEYRDEIAALPSATMVTGLSGHSSKAA
jgi:hypothetical protein